MSNKPSTDSAEVLVVNLHNVSTGLLKLLQTTAVVNRGSMLAATSSGTQLCAMATADELLPVSEP